MSHTNFTEEAWFSKLNGLMTAAGDFIRGPEAEKHYVTLLNAIRSMERPEDNLPNFDIAAAGAWGKAWSIYSRLLQREKRPPSEAQISNAVREQAEQRAWGEYLNSRGELVELARRGILTPDLAEYAGLKPGDLNLPNAPQPADMKSQDYIDWMNMGGKRPDWRAVAHRCGLAVDAITNMPVQERRSVPLIMAARRADAATERLTARVEQMEKAEIDIPAFR